MNIAGSGVCDRASSQLVHKSALPDSQPCAVLRASCVSIAVLLLCAATAQAEISPVAPIDGPSAEIVELGGAAMAADGTGGIVYRKRVEGRAHIFASQYVGDKWEAPQRVDVGEKFESSFPAIAAGEGGRLVVVWANHYSSTTDGLFSATMDPGSAGFQPPVPVDLNIGQATGTYPSVAMDLSGDAYVSYRVITAVSGPSTPNIPPGYVQGEIRMAHYNGQYWSTFGEPLNRDVNQPVLQPTALNSPQVAIDVSGEGLLAWQEPDDNFINRIYARRIFGLVPGNLLDVSPSTYNGHPLNGAAAELSLDFAGFGEGAIAWRQEPSSGSGFSHPRVFVSEVPSSFSPKGAAFGPAKPVEGPPGGEGPAEALGPLSMAVDAEGGFDVGYCAGDQSFDGNGSETTVGTPIRLDTGSEVPGNPVLTRADDGALAAAWKVQIHGAGAVAVLERRADGTPNRAIVAAPHGGAVGQLAMGGSHRGDAIFGFLQGSGANAQIAAVVVRAPPGSFVADTPNGWVKAKRIPLQWEVPLAGAGKITYSILVDDREAVEGVTGNEYLLNSEQVGNGVHSIQIEATDALGQVVDSAPATLKVARTGPSVSMRARGARVTVRLSDRPKGESPGVKKSSVKVGFGDGVSAHGSTTLEHIYPRAGTYTIVVSASDKAGNKTTIRRRVKIS